MAVGFSGINTLTELWNGSGWSVTSSPDTAQGDQDNLLGVSCLGAGLCDAVGYSHLPGGSNETLIESWNGTSWSIVPSPNPLQSGFSILEGISCTAPSLCNAGGRWYGVNPNMPGQVTTPTETLIETIGGQVLGGPVAGISADPVTGGYLLVAADGGVDAFNARYFGAVGGLLLSQPIVGLASTHNGQGYWEVTSDGGVFAFGDAQFHGSTGAIHLNKPVVGMTATPDGGGYWLVASDGGVFAFGNAPFHGSAGAIPLNMPVVGMAATPDGGGYWLIASDGGVFAFGDAQFHGGTGSLTLNKPVVGMAATPDGKGYWLVASDGGIFSFGGAQFYGSAVD